MRVIYTPVAIYTPVVSAAVLFTCLAFMGGCGSSSSDGPPTASISTADEEDSVDSWSSESVSTAASVTTGNSPPKPEPKNLHPKVEIKTNLGKICLKLDTEKAPQTVENFLVNYVDTGFYDGTVVHYVEQDYLIIAGAYTEDLQLKSTRAPILNEARTASKNLRGTIAMSRDPDYADSATSQFFINLTDNDGLDFKESEDDVNNGYCVFGEVIEGMDLIERIASAKVHEMKELPNVPVDSIVIESVTRIDTKATKRP